jgi:hypothetical protein
MPSNDLIRRLNHFVPAGYLAAFTNTGKKDGELWAYRRSAPKRPLCTRPTAIAKKRDLYVVRTETGELNDSIERFFATAIESPFMAVRNRLVYGSFDGLSPSLSSLTNDERTTVARFVAFQQLRTPAEQRAMDWLSALNGVRFFSEARAPGSEARLQLEQFAGRELDPEEIAAFRSLLLDKQGRLAWTPAQWLPIALRNAVRLSLLILGDMQWHLILAREGVEFVTCDVPVVCVRRMKGHGTFELGGGWQQPGFEATLALSPTHVLYLTRTAPSSEYVNSAAFTREIRQRTLSFAQDWVFARSQATDITCTLSETEAPDYLIAFNGRSYRVGDSVVPILAAMEREGVSSIEFRWGLAKRPPHSARTR